MDLGRARKLADPSGRNPSVVYRKMQSWERKRSRCRHYLEGRTPGFRSSHSPDHLGMAPSRAGDAAPMLVDFGQWRLSEFNEPGCTRGGPGGGGPAIGLPAPRD